MSANKKHYVNKYGTITIQCPTCLNIRHVSIDQLKEKKHTVKIKCSCSETFSIDIEFRINYRKKTRFHGRYRHIPDNLKRENYCIVTDMSVNGVAVEISNINTIKIGDKLVINFSLDNNHQDEIEKIIKVIRVDSENLIIGCEFIDSGIIKYDKLIYFYLQ